MLHIHHMNLQPMTGGGEVYTHAMTRAILETGARVTLYVHPDNHLWDDLPKLGAERADAWNESAFLSALPASRALVLAQGPISAACATEVGRRHTFVQFAHMPIIAGRSASGFQHAHLVATVSHYCIGLLRAAGVERLYPEPLYGTAEAQRCFDHAVIARSPYRWDHRKIRDVVFGLFQPLVRATCAPRQFERRPGITLGVVSLLSPIKQFPLLFSSIVTHLARHPQVNLEIFGEGGYSQVRAIRRALAPLGSRVRFWGYQRNVHAVYPQLDYLLAGLPEKEALGLNVLEAQLCGTPVLAPRAPPFTETMVPGRSGFLYRDPREDNGADFSSMLDAIISGCARPSPQVEAADHLKRFSFEALVERVRPFLRSLRELKRR